ncbi:MAG TPA: FAD-binding oxidoreductase [Candidatus Saccharimonadales bacterium]
MSKIAHYLQEHLTGEVMTSVDARRYFSTDGSILSIPPALIAYPKNENDVRKAARFSWQLAERGRVISLTPRGSGTDATGGAIGTGLMIVFPAHMNRILELDTKSGQVTIEPGINFGKLQQTLQTHSRFIPVYPPTIEYSTVGGAVAKNIAGEKSLKYGPIGDYVKRLRVVLANGEVIETERFSKRDLSKKLGLATFEGEIYRAVDTLIEENHELVAAMLRPVTKNNTGYNLVDIKGKDGSFDLSPLFIGGQGTLGIITELTLDTDVYNPETTLIMAGFEDLGNLQTAINELRASKEPPSVMEIVNQGLIEAVNELNPNQLKDLLPNPHPAYVLFVEYDNTPDRNQKRLVHRAQKVFQNLATSVQVETDTESQQRLWKVRQASSAYIGHNDGFKKASPIIGDSAVPVDRLAELIAGVSDIFRQVDIKPVAIWGHAGDGILHMQPHLNLSQVGDRQKAFRLMDEYYKLVLSLGGTLSGDQGDGCLKAPYLEQQYGSEVYALLKKVKQIFDPYGTLNPGVKFGTSLDDIKRLLRPEYSFGHIYDHLPRS